MTLEEILDHWGKPDREITSQLWRFVRGDNTYRIFTNGHFLIAEAVDANDNRYEYAKKAAFENLFEAAEGADYTDFPRDALVDFCGDLSLVAQKYPCHDCHDGSTSRTCNDCGHVHDCMCDSCEGAGFIEEDLPPVHGRYGKSTLNSRYVRLVADVLRDTEYSAVETPFDGGHLVVFRAGPHYGFVMCMKDDHHSHTRPVFEPMRPADSAP